MTGLRILIVSQHYPPEVSGNASRIGDMAKALAAAGANVTVLAPHPNFPNGTFRRRWRIWRRRKDGDVEVVNLLSWQPSKSNPSNMSRALYYVTFPWHVAGWLLWHRRFDVLVCSMPPPFTAMASYMVGRKMLAVDMRDLFIDAAVGLGLAKEGSILVKASRKLEARALRRAQVVATTTMDMAGKLRARGLIADGATIVHCPNGVDAARFAGAPGLPEARFVYAGNVGHAQDLACAIRAIALVRKTHPQARLEILGDGDTRQDLSDLASSLQLNGAVRFAGVVPRNEIPEKLATAAGGLAFLRKEPTLDYAVPTKAYEYAAAGIPFLVADLTESRALAEASKGGLVSANEPAALASQMAWVIEHPTEARAMGARGRAYVLANYERSAIAARLLAALEAVHERT